MMLFSLVACGGDDDILEGLTPLEEAGSNEPVDEPASQQDTADNNAVERLLNVLKEITGAESDSLEKQFFLYYQAHNYELAMMPVFEKNSLQNWDDLTLFVLLNNDNQMTIDGVQALTAETFNQTVTRFFGTVEYPDKSSKHITFKDGIYTAVPGDTMRSGYFWLKEMNAVDGEYTAIFDAFYFGDMDFTADYEQATPNQRAVRDQAGTKDCLQPLTFASAILEILENEDYASILDVSETVTITFSLSNDPKNPLTYTSCSVQKSNELIYDGSRYAGNGSFIFFANSTDDDSLYRMTSDLTEEVLLDDSLCSSLYLDEDYIYYNSWIHDVSSRTSPDPDICRICIDGTGRKVIVEKATIVGMSSDSIFFINSEHQLRSIQKDGNIETLLLSDVTDSSYFTVTENYVFYSNLSDEDTHGLYRIDVDGNRQIKISDDYATWVVVVDERIYYVSNDEELVTMDLDGSNKRTIAVGSFGRVYIDDQWIYYSDYASIPHSLCKMNLDGDEKAVLFNESNVAEITKIGNKLFFETYTSDAEGVNTYHYCLDMDDNRLLKFDREQNKLEFILVTNNKE